MDKTTKTKIILIAGVIIFALLVFLGVSALSTKKPKDNNSDQEVSLRADGKNEFTTEDMMKAQEDKTSYENTQTSSSDYSSVSTSTSSSVPAYHGDNSEVQELQRQLRENQNTQTLDESASEPAPAPSTTKYKKPKTIKTYATKEVSMEQPTVAVISEPTPKPKVNTNPNGRSRNLTTPKQGVTNNLISAVIHNDQVITSGAKVKLRIVESIVVDGVTIPTNSFVFGIATFSKARMNITLSSIIVGSSIIPFNKSVYDKDGMEGIYLPENVKSEDAKEATNDMSSEALNAVNSAGIVGAALNTGKNIFRRKAQRQTVTLKANYKLFLK